MPSLQIARLAKIYGICGSTNVSFVWEQNGKDVMYTFLFLMQCEIFQGYIHTQVNSTFASYT